MLNRTTRCVVCNCELSPLQLNIHKRIVNNAQLTTYKCMGCITKPSRISYDEFAANIQTDIEKNQSKVNKLENKLTESRDKITRHINTLQRLKAENESILDEIVRVRLDRDNNRELLSRITIERELLNDNINSQNPPKSQDSEKSGHICPICTDNPIDCVLVECGHAMCMLCSSLIDRECPFCRKAKPSDGFNIIKIYLG